MARRNETAFDFGFGIPGPVTPDRRCSSRCAPPEVQEDAAGGFEEAADFAAVAALINETRVGDETQAVKFTQSAVASLGFTPAPATASVSPVVLLAENREKLPVRVVIRTGPLPGPVDGRLYLGATDTQLVAAALVDSSIDCPSAPMVIAASTRIETILWPTKKIYGRVVGPIAAATNLIVVQQLSYRSLYQNLLEGVRVLRDGQ